jgi:hypothetical protein
MAPKGKKWFSALKTLYNPSNLSDTHRSLVTPRPSTRKPKSGVESERRAQQRLVQWLYEEGIIFFSVPNGANVTPHHRQTLLSEGLSPGMVDLVIPIPSRGYHSLYLELKREDGGVISPEQKKWIEVLNYHGHRAIVCRGFEKAKQEIEWYLNEGI